MRQAVKILLTGAVVLAALPFLLWLVVLMRDALTNLGINIKVAVILSAISAGIILQALRPLALRIDPDGGLRVKPPAPNPNRPSDPD